MTDEQRVTFVLFELEELREALELADHSSDLERNDSGLAHLLM